MIYYIYVLRCTGNTLYTGITPNLKRRLRQHRGEIAGGAKYTRSHPPQAVEQVWKTDGHAAAARFEYAFKRLPRQRKLELLRNPTEWVRFFPRLEEGAYAVVTEEESLQNS